MHLLIASDDGPLLSIPFARSSDVLTDITKIKQMDEYRSPSAWQLASVLVACVRVVQSDRKSTFTLLLL